MFIVAFPSNSFASIRVEDITLSIVLKKVIDDSFAADLLCCTVQVQYCELDLNKKKRADASDKFT